MRLQSPEHFATAIRAVEAELGVRYPPLAAGLFAELAAILDSGHPHGLFKGGRLLTTATVVAAMRDELGGPLYDGYLLPFLSDEQGKFPNVYGFDLSDPERSRVAVYSVHTIVEVWPTVAAFLAWAHDFVPPSPGKPDGAA
ncbi:MAG TPA: hypothetical protein VF796_23810 [Humisphaera sp.]